LIRSAVTTTTTGEPAATATATTTAESATSTDATRRVSARATTGGAATCTTNARISARRAASGHCDGRRHQFGSICQDRDSKRRGAQQKRAAQAARASDPRSRWKTDL
jgi:hypothetical protein